MKILSPSPWRRLTSAAIIAISCIILATMATKTVVFAQDTAFSGCKTKQSCDECLETSSCDWWNLGGCLENSASLTDVSRYSMDNNNSASDTTTTIANICQRAANDQADENSCRSMSSCTSCIETFLLDGVTTCKWFENSEDSGCGSGCGMLGCGATTCIVVSAETAVLDDVASIPEATSGGSNNRNCNSKSSCEECIKASDESASCAWVPALFYESYPCTETSCDLIADPKCFTMESSGDGSITRAASEICENSSTSETPDVVSAATPIRNKSSVLLLFISLMFLE